MQISLPRRTHGFSLIELSVATAIYSLGLGSLSLMMMIAVQGTNEAHFDTTATNQLSSLAEMILMTPDASGLYDDSSDYGGAACDLGHACSAEEMAAWQFATWRGRVAAELPRGRGTVCRDQTAYDGEATDPACDGAGSRVIKVFWQPGSDPDDADGGSARRLLRLP